MDQITKALSFPASFAQRIVFEKSWPEVGATLLEGNESPSNVYSACIRRWRRRRKESKLERAERWLWGRQPARQKERVNLRFTAYLKTLRFILCHPNYPPTPAQPRSIGPQQHIRRSWPQGGTLWTFLLSSPTPSKKKKKLRKEGRGEGARHRTAPTKNNLKTHPIILKI